MGNNERIFLASPHMSDEGYEQEYIKEAFDTNWIAPLGANVNNFEKEICDYTGAKDAAALYQNVAGDSSLHTKLYRYLTHQIILQPSELVDAFSEGNRARFCAYLRKREEEKL